MDLASVVAALASVGVRVSGSTSNNNIQGDSSRACPTGLAGPEPSGTHNDPGQHFQTLGTNISLSTAHLPLIHVLSHSPNPLTTSHTTSIHIKDDPQPSPQSPANPLHFNFMHFSFILK